MARFIPRSMWVFPLLTPEQRLWRAVLEQARADADSSPESDPDLQPATRAIARRFLCAASPCEAQVLALVCEFADVPYDRVVLWARQRYPLQADEAACSPGTVAEIVAEELDVAELWESPPN